MRSGLRFSATPIFLFVSARRAVTTSNSVHVVLFVSARRAVTTSNSVHVILFVSARRAMTTSNLVHVIRFWVSILHKPWIESEGRRGHRPLQIPTHLGSLPLEGDSPVKRGKCPRSGQKGAASRRVRWPRRQKADEDGGSFYNTLLISKLPQSRLTPCQPPREGAYFALSF